MSHQTKIVKVRNQLVHLQLPGRCKICGASLPVKTEVLSEGYTSNMRGAYAEHGTYYLVQKCPFCESVLTNLFSIRPDSRDRTRISEYGRPAVQTPKIKEADFPQQISDISPRFVSVYTQSFKAERIGLTELAGMGYRKALEMLVKDYAIHKFPNLGTKIAKESLQDALTQIDTNEIKVLAQVAIKIGNDETHYYRKHDWDISELKGYIESINVFILSDLNTIQAKVRLDEDHSSGHQ
ncbi:hypothetical protein [Lacticaseibacillus paracasei]|uniref:hypothetical protein n=1 Tax=Lacticaseibacillus paracasei TaxID=1597 RepID=UPI00237F93E4|nr:hypothetical protein [Lacticaseibacillus paracasei]MDE3285553.1 hypothetical protein [Lacticaseibacillus paracasei]